MKKKFGIGLLTMILFTLLGACGQVDNQNRSEEKDKLDIVTTFYPVYDFTKNIVGDAGNVEMLIPAGTEPHDWEPSAKNMAKIQEADVFVYHDPNLETWAQKVVKARDKKLSIQGTKGITLRSASEEEGHEKSHSHQLDPHTWVDPHLAIKEVKTIEQQLIAKYPSKKKIFQKNADKYLTKLEKLDAKYKEELAQAKQKSFVTQHAAFAYLAAEYGLTQVPISGLSPDEEPSPKRLAELKEYVQKNEIKYIYFEESASDKIAKTLADETKVKLMVLSPVESLTKKQIKAGEDYISVMEDNLTALKKTTDTSGKTIKAETEQSSETE